MTPAPMQAAEDAGSLSPKVLAFLATSLVPDSAGNLIMLPADTWGGMWWLMHAVKAIGDGKAAPPSSPATITDLIVERMAERFADPTR